jgi:hypothetical protein
VGTSASNKGGTGGGWTEFKRSSSNFARYGGRERAAKALAGYVAAMGGVAAAVAAATAGTRTGQSLGTFLAGSTGPEGLAGGLEAVGLERLVGQDRFTVLSELLTVFGGTGSDLEDQAARDALLDVLDELLPQDEDLQSVRLDETAVTEALGRYIELLVYNRAIPVIDVRLEQLQNQALIQQRDRQLRDFIHALVRLKMQETSPLTIDWEGTGGKEFIEGILGAVYEQLEEWG